MPDQTGQPLWMTLSGGRPSVRIVISTEDSVAVQELAKKLQEAGAKIQWRVMARQFELFVDNVDQKPMDEADMLQKMKQVLDLLKPPR